MSPTHVPRPVALQPDQIQRGIGAFLGAAVGDALGAPFEFGPPGAYRARFPQPVEDGTGEMAGGGGFGWRPGEFTDDTQMAVALAESLLAHGGLDEDDLWARWRTWATDAPDVGVITRSSLRHPTWRDAAATAHRSLGRSAGNGSLMRVTPVALAHAATDPAIATATCMDVAALQSALTHHDPAAGWGAAIGAELIRRTILGSDPIVELPAVLAMVPAPHAERYHAMLHPEWCPTPRRADEPGNGSVWGCLAQAVWAVRHHATFHDAVVAAIDLGDDTDTVACVTGALAGARDGVDAIPERWAAVVHGALRTDDGIRRYGCADLWAMAEALLTGPA